MCFSVDKSILNLMDEIKIGDIIQPTTPTRRKQYGKGIVVNTKQSQRFSTTAVFPLINGSFQYHDFKEEHLALTEVTDNERETIIEAGQSYNQMMLELKSI